MDSDTLQKPAAPFSG